MGREYVRAPMLTLSAGLRRGRGGCRTLKGVTPPWLPLLQHALEENQNDRAVQVATVSPGGEPEVRTVILRGLSEEGEPYFFTDARAAKVRAVEAGLELCAWWNDTQEQFRLRGPVTLVTSNDSPWGERRRELWAHRGEESRKSFLGAVPGTPLEEASNSDKSKEDQEEPPETFVLMVVKPERVDYLKLGEEQERWVWWLEGGVWRGGPVVP